MQRRMFFLKTLAGAAALGLGRSVLADDRTPLREDDPKAIEFGYRDDTARVDEHRYPEHKPEQRCAKCQIFEDMPDGIGGCPLFAGRTVRAAGWCSAFS